MKIKLTFECEHCIEDLTLEYNVGKNLPSMKDVRADADKKGWKLGGRAFCPDCYTKLPAHCNTCEYYEGNKSMGAPLCLKHNCFVCPTDFCEAHSKIDGPRKPLASGYQNPIPNIK